MKQVGESVTRESQNAWGAYHDMTYTIFEVEESDVGQTRRHYRGFHHSKYSFTTGDVGRCIQVMTDPNDAPYTCWVFNNPKRIRDDQAR